MDSIREEVYTVDNPASDRATAARPVRPIPNRPDLIYFAETGHTLAGPFLDYWRSHGGQMQFGYPITEAYIGLSPIDGSHCVRQFYQRLWLEWHPENRGTPYEIQIGLLGVDQWINGLVGKN